MQIPLKFFFHLALHKIFYSFRNYSHKIVFLNNKILKILKILALKIEISKYFKKIKDMPKITLKYNIIIFSK